MSVGPLETKFGEIRIEASSGLSPLTCISPVYHSCRSITLQLWADSYASIWYPSHGVTLEDKSFRRFWCKKQVYQVGIRNCILQNTVGYKYFTLPETPASGTKALICPSAFPSAFRMQYTMKQWITHAWCQVLKKSARYHQVRSRIYRII